MNTSRQIAEETAARCINRFDGSAYPQAIVAATIEEALNRFAPKPLGRDEAGRLLFDLITGNGCLWFTLEEFAREVYRQKAETFTKELFSRDLANLPEKGDDCETRRSKSIERLSAIGEQKLAEIGEQRQGIGTAETEQDRKDNLADHLNQEAKDKRCEREFDEAQAALRGQEGEK